LVDLGVCTRGLLLGVDLDLVGDLVGVVGVVGVPESFDLPLLDLGRGFVESFGGVVPLFCLDILLV
jgi:hypothetical protein